MPTNDLMQPFMAPFAKLAQSNLELFTKFSLSPEVVSQAMAQAQRMFLQQSPGMAPLQPLQVSPNAVADLMMGLMKNYMEFLMELGQGSAALMQQAPTTLARATQQATRQASTKAATAVPPTA